MAARPTQLRIFKLLQTIYGCNAVMEWPSNNAATDALAAAGHYRPRLDICVRPDNIHSDRALRDKLLHTAKTDLLCRKLIDSKHVSLNKNPRCLFAIEIIYSGSSKHILGDFTNASMLGAIGVLIVSDILRAKVSRIEKYVDFLRHVDKATQEFLANVVVYTEEDFITLLETTFSAQ